MGRSPAGHGWETKLTGRFFGRIAFWLAATQASAAECLKQMMRERIQYLAETYPQ
jgi:hypothetical protein